MSVDQSPQSDNFADTVVTIWSKAIDTQMHFNEMSAKSRQLGLTFVAAALGLAVFVFSHSGSDAKYTYDITIRQHTITLHVAEFIILAAALSVYAVKLLDLGVYHKMLRGAVAFGEDLEKSHLRGMLGLNRGMTEAISHFSRHSDAAVCQSGSAAAIYIGDDKRTAEKKIEKFYWVIIIALIIAAFTMFAIGNNLI